MTSAETTDSSKSSVEVKLYRFDPATFLSCPETIRCYMAEAAINPDAGESIESIGHIARAIGLQVMARNAGVPFEDLAGALAATWDEPLFRRTIAKVVETYRREPQPFRPRLHR